MKAALFDMDGTLLHSEYVAVPAFKQTFQELKAKGLYQGEMPNEELLLHQLGKTLDKIWETLLPDADKKTHLLADKIMLEKEIDIIKRGEMVFYPGVKETLGKIKENGFNIFVVSNGLEKYIEVIVKYSGFDHLFTDLYSAGRFQTKSKIDLVAKLFQNYPVDATGSYMIGDRESDVEAGNNNKLPTIGCLFGYGSREELKDATYLIKNFPDVLDIIL